MGREGIDMKHGFTCAAASVLLAFVIPFAARAEQKPLWEAGLGIGALVFPDYRGSDETNVYPVPVPYFVYRGDFLKADREGLRGEFFDREYAELNVSLNATIPVQSEHNRARRGMPNLRATVEAGPSLNLHLWHSPDRRMKFDVVLPLRFPLTLESSPQFIGWNFSQRNISKSFDQRRAPVAVRSEVIKRERADLDAVYAQEVRECVLEQLVPQPAL